MSDTASLAILLDGPMQAWGVSSRFQRRETEAFPVKSSLVGLLAAAMRIDKLEIGEAERLVPLAALRVDAYRLPKPNSKVSAKSHDVQRLVDFHTIGGGYDKDASAMEKLSIPRKASGPPFGTVITRRTYLTDARFVAVFTGDAATIGSAAASLANPAWGVWFGRKACLPALPLSPTVAPTSDEALGLLLSRVAEWDEREALDPATLECWQEPETTDPAEGDFFLHDAPLSFKERALAVRPVRHKRAKKRVSGRHAGALNVTEAFFEALPEVDLAAWESGEPDPTTN